MSFVALQYELFLVVSFVAVYLWQYCLFLCNMSYVWQCHLLQCNWAVSGGAIYYFARILAMPSVVLCDMSYVWQCHIAVQCRLFLAVLFVAV